MASLGTLTLDLVARTSGFVQGLSKAERQSEKWRRKVARDAAQVGKALAGATTALAGAVTALTVQTTKAATEIARQSQLANATTTEFQRFAAGAKAVGIEQDKLSDILKDVNDKVGDFLTTGGGPLLDFFEQVAPKIGVTAEQFRNLSGPDALQLYVSSLEQANLSQAELTFFLEAIANDATALLPLLKNNGTALNEFADAAAASGKILDEDVIAAARDLRDTFTDLENNFVGSRNLVAVELLPVFRDLSIAFDDLRIDSDGASRAGEALTIVIKGLVSGATIVAGTFNLAGKGIAGFAATIAALPRGLGAAKAAFKEFAFDAGQEIESIQLQLSDIFSAGTPVAQASADFLPGRSRRTLPTLGQGASPVVEQERAQQEAIAETVEEGEIKTTAILEEALQERARLREQYANQEQRTLVQSQEQTAAVYESSFGQISDVARQFAGEQSGIYRALFAVEKGAAIARSIVAIQTAIAQAASSGPFPANLAAMASVASATAGLVSTIASTTIQGQAHDGLMSVPKTGTYLLEKGERVTTADTSAKLDKQLDQMQGGGIRIINSIDPGVMGDYMGSTQGERVIMNVIRRNQRTVQALATA